MSKTKRFLSVLLSVLMLLQTLVIPNFAADVSGFVDFPVNSWSSAAMNAAVENGLIVGTSDTTIEPSKNVTRAEFAAIVTRAFGATKTADISNFADVDESDWYYTSVAKAVQMGVMNGTGAASFDPQAFMKREDVILSLARVLFVDKEDATILEQFSDHDEIDPWADNAIAGMVAEGYVHGYEDGTIKPRSYITREELAQLFYNIFKIYVSVEGTYDYLNGDGSVIIRTPGVTLRNITINGDLVMADGIGEGDLELVNVKVLGKIIARGGEGTVYFKGVESEGTVIINDPNGVVNFHNYRDEKPFVDNLFENTPATFLERGTAAGGGGSLAGGGGGGGGGTSSQTYTITFYDDEGEVLHSEKGKSNARVEYVPTPEKDGYVFMGWRKNGEGTVRASEYFIGAKIGAVQGKWYAYFEEDAEALDEYTITFVTDDGETVIEAIEGESLSETDIPEVEVDESKEFLGWTTEEGSETVEFTNEQLTADVVENVFDETEVKLYPVVVDKDAYVVAFVGANTVTKYDPEYVLDEDDVPADPEKDGYVFIGWSTDADATEGEDRDYFIEKEISEVVGTWYPVFAKEYTITFVTDDGETVIEAIEGESLSETDIPEVEVDESKEFLGWTTEEGSETVEFTNEQLTAGVVENVFDETEVKLYPVVVDKDAYVVAFVGANTVTKYDPEYVLDEDDVPADPEKEGFAFEGWSTDAEAVEGEDRDYFIEKEISEVVGTWYPVFRELEKYTITFALHGEDKTVTKTEGQSLEASDIPADPEKEGFTFKGWSKDANATEGKTSEELLELNLSELEGTWYPIFEEDEIPEEPEEYTITFILDGEDKTVTKTEGQSLEESDIPEITVDESKEFKGWATTAGSTNVAYTNEELTADTVENVFDNLETKLYPVVVEKDVYLVVFDGVENGEIKKYDEPDYVIVDSDVPADPEEEGFTFKGWSKDANATEGEDRNFFIGKTIEEVVGTWYPVFEEIEVPDEYTIVFALESADKTVTKTEGQSLEASDIPEITLDESKKFEGWTKTEGSTNVDFTNEELTADTVENVFDSLETTLYPVVVDKDVYLVVFDGVENGEIKKYDNPDYVIVDSDVPADPEKENYTFIGWSKDANATEGEDRSFFIGKTIEEVAGTWYPIFELIVLPDEYTITFVLEGEDKTVTKTEGQSLEASDIPEVSVDVSKEFKGWTTDPEGTEVEFTDDELIADVVENIFDSLETKLYPVIADKTEYVVVFDGIDDGEITSYDPEYVITDADVPADPEKENYTFIGWSKDANATEGEDRSFFIGKAIKDVAGTWYPVYEIIEEPDEYTIVFIISGRDKTVTKLEGESLAENDIPAVGDEETKTFIGWTTVENGTVVEFTSEELTADTVDALFDSTEVELYPVFEAKEYYKVEFVTTDRDVITEGYDGEYVLTESDVPADPTKDGYRFMGWSQDANATEGEGRDYFVGNTLANVSGVWRAVFALETSYKVEFKYTNGDDALDAVEATLIESERYPVSVTDVAHYERPDDYKFLGWTTEIDGTEYIASSELDGKDIRDLDEVYYAQFELLTIEYEVSFKFTDGSVALDPVSGVLSPSEDYELTSEDVYDVEHPEKPDDYKFLGWTTDVDGTEYIASTDIVGLKIKEDNLNGVTYYAQFEKITDNYFVFFKYTNGSEALPAIEETLSPSEDYVITAEDVYDVDYFEEPYEKYVFLGWTTDIDGTDYIASSDIVGLKIKGDNLDDVTYYAQFETLVLVTFYDLGLQTEPVVEPVYVSAGTNAFYPDSDEYTLWYELGYEKSYDTEYFDPDGDGYTAEENVHGYDYAHRLDFEWYYEDENGDFVRYTDDTVINEDIDVYAKIRKVDISIEIPKSIVDVDEPLILNIPYEDDTRFIDLVRDALFFNADQLTSKINETGIEDKLYEKLSGIGSSYFENGGLLNDDNEINKTDVLVRFYLLKQSKTEFANWLWEECEDSVIEGLGAEKKAEYKNDVRPGRSAAEALKIYFEDMRDAYNPPESSVEKYEASKLFIYEVNEEDEFTVTEDNGFITEKVAGEIAKVGDFYSALDYIAGDRIPDGLLDKLPIEEIVVPIYDNSIGAFSEQFEQAKADAEATGEPQMVSSGFRFNINLITEIIAPLMDWSKNTHNNALDRVVASNNRIAEFAEKYYIENPYAAGFDGGCAGFVNGYVDPDLYFDELGNDNDLYAIRPISEIYFDVLMPLSVEATDAFIWFTKNSDFAKLEKILMDEENMELVLHFVNHTNALMEEYAANGLPEDIVDYYNDLLEDEVIENAVEKLNDVIEGKRDGFDMMYFVETKLKNNLAEMLYMKALNRLGVPAEMLLGQYVNTPVNKEYTEEDYENYVSQLEQIWLDTYMTDDGLDNLFNIAGGDDSATLAVKGFSMTISRALSDAMMN